LASFVIKDASLMIKEASFFVREAILMIEDAYFFTWYVLFILK
jgi:hypothetical protein